MGDFSTGSAIGAGFRLLAREPLAFLAWALAYLLIGVLPQIGVFALILPEWLRLTQEIASSASVNSPLPPTEMFRAQAQMMQLQPISWLAGIASQALVLSAIYRAVLFPEDRRFFYLRLSMREVWLGLVMLVLFVMIAMLFFVIMLPLAVIGGIVSAFAQDAPAVGLLIVPVVIAAIAVVVWVLLRLSLATPMSFAQRGFRLYESWSLTRGHAAKMFLVALALAIVLWLIEVVVMGVVLALIGGFAGLGHLGQWFQHPQLDMHRLMPWAIVGGGVLALVSTAVFTLFAAAWGEIYREISDEPVVA
ncbi:MAG TPA: hypothetical protein VFW13_15830 [Phenylobacterium sp.]|nr:hypothetical protein [Phenylobacterium sp.]